MLLLIQYVNLVKLRSGKTGMVLRKIGKAILFSSLLVSSWGSLQISQPAYAQLPQSHAESSNSLPERLFGRWRGEDPTTQEPVILVFTSTGQLYILANDQEKKPIAIKMWYEIADGQDNFTHLDLQVNSQQTAPTLFKITPQGQLLLQLDGVSPDNPRLETLGSTATLFELVTRDVTISPDREVVTLPEPATSAPVAIQYISVLAQAQQRYFLQTGSFASSLEELGIAGIMETQQYRYKLEPLGDEEGIAIMAEPKESGIQSYTGVVLAAEDGTERETITAICQSNQPSDIPPIPTLLNGQIQCSPDSSLRE